MGSEHEDPRVAAAMRAENRGTTAQRQQAISERRPVTIGGWRIHYGDDGMASKMSWHPPASAVPRGDGTAHVYPPPPPPLSASKGDPGA